MLVNGLDPNKSIREEALERLADLSQPVKGQLDFKVDGSVWQDGKLVAEEPSFEQKQWVLFRLRHSNTWPNSHQNKIRDSDNWVNSK